MTRAALAPALGLALLLPLTACGDDSGSGDPERASASSSSDATAEASATATPSATDAPESSQSASATAEPSEAPTGTPSATASPADPTVSPAPGLPTATGGPYGRLLTAAELPGLDDDWAWSEFETRPRESGLFTLCQRFLFSDIGATDVVLRRFDAAVPGADGDGAGQVVATFPDGKQARQAESVLQSWAEDCEPDDSSVQAEVSPWTRVQVADGSAAWYAVRVTADNAEESRTERVTVARRANRVTVVRSLALGAEREYAAGQDPAALTTRPAASKLTR